MKRYSGMAVVALAMAITMFLVGCLGRGQVIKDLETDKVVVVETGELPSVAEDIWSLAQQGCAIHGRTPTPVSTHIPPATYSSGVVTSVTTTGEVVSGVATTATTYKREHLFACIDPEGVD